MSWLRSNLLILIASLAVPVLIGVAIFGLSTYRPFWIPAGSMKPTLLVGDYVVVNQTAYGADCLLRMCSPDPDATDQEPLRGDVVVFQHPVSRHYYVKRMVGLPGDTIQMESGVLMVNGAPQKLEPIGVFEEAFARQGQMGSLPACSNGSPDAGGVCEKAQLTETLDDGVTHDILNIRDGLSGDDTPVFEVPEGHFFAMGDNRDNSVDSRFPQAAGGVGFVPFANLLGRADRVIFSSAGRRMLYFWTWRSDRFFKAIE